MGGMSVVHRMKSAACVKRSGVHGIGGEAHDLQMVCGVFKQLVWQQPSNILLTERIVAARHIGRIP